MKRWTRHKLRSSRALQFLLRWFTGLLWVLQQSRFLWSFDGLPPGVNDLHQQVVHGIGVVPLPNPLGSQIVQAVDHIAAFLLRQGYMIFRLKHGIRLLWSCYSIRLPNLQFCDPVVQELYGRCIFAPIAHQKIQQKQYPPGSVLSPREDSCCNGSAAFLPIIY